MPLRYFVDGRACGVQKKECSRYAAVYKWHVATSVVVVCAITRVCVLINVFTVGCKQRCTIASLRTSRIQCHTEVSGCGGKTWVGRVEHVAVLEKRMRCMLCTHPCH